MDTISASEWLTCFLLLHLFPVECSNHEGDYSNITFDINSSFFFGGGGALVIFFIFTKRTAGIQCDKWDLLEERFNL